MYIHTYILYMLRVIRVSNGLWDLEIVEIRLTIEYGVAMQ